MSIPRHCGNPIYLAALPSEDLLDPRYKISHCRFCAREMKCEQLLDLSTDKETMELYLIILEFFKIDFIDFSGSKIPKTTCESCYNMITKCYGYFLTVKASQTVLKEFYGVNDEKCDVDILETKTETVQNDCQNEDLTSDSNFENKEEIMSIKSRRSSIVSNCSQQSLNESKSSIGETEDLENNESHKNTSNKSTPESDDILKFSLNLYCGIPLFENGYDEVNDSNQSTPDIHSESSNDESYTNDDDYENNDKVPTKKTEDSWNTYPWSCLHCQVECKNLDDLRSHSTQLHKKCYALQCVDCHRKHNVFNKFNPFIEHVRLHRQELRYYCPYCNDRFESIEDCTNHALTHWSGGQQICEWCGQLFPDAAALKVHKTLSQQVRLSKHAARILSIEAQLTASARKYNEISVFEEKPTGRTWDDYEWTCQECSQRFPNVESLRTHTQQLHDKCFSMKCADCLKLSRNYRFFVKHVTDHRPYLKNYCPYCNKNIEDEKELQKHVDDHFIGPQKPCDGCGQIFENKHIEAEHFNKFNPERRRKYLTTADLTCDVCKKIFNKMSNLRTHKKLHDENRKKDHICHSCGKQFPNKSSLDLHMATHDGKTQTCKVCNKSFSKPKLKQHVIRHLKRDKFICDYCSKGFPMKHVLKDHIIQHHLRKLIKKYKCQLCDKLFKTPRGLKLHMNIHTGARPYQCENCDKTFTNWANCNKHMKRIHKTTLKKNKLAHKITPLSDEKVNNMAADTKEWIDHIVKDKRVASNKTCKKAT